MKIISIGETAIDYYRRQQLTFVGGISLNFAVHAKRSGAEQVSLVSCVGNDGDEIRIFATLAREGIDHTHVAVVAGKTAVCAIDVNDNADRYFPPDGYHLHALRQLHLTDTTIAAICQHDIMVSMYQGEWPGPLLDQLLTLPNFAGKRVVDFGDWTAGNIKTDALAPLQAVDLAFVSGDETTLATMQPIAAAAQGLIVISMGAAGSAALTSNGILFQPAIPVAQSIDSTGCGDAFQAAFTVNYFRDGNIAKALAKGAAQAAGVLQHFGAFQPNGR